MCLRHRLTDEHCSQIIRVIIEGAQIEEFDFDAGLYDRLRDLRNKLAKQQGVPSYQVFPNKTLEYFTRLRPKTLDAGRRIKGVGELKAEKYLEYFIDEINQA